METTRESRQGDLTRRVEDFRAAYEARDIDRMLELFADDAEYTAAPGTFQGKPAIRGFLEWDKGLSPTATIRDTGIKMLASDRTVVWERQRALTAEGAPYQENALTVIEFDDCGLIRNVRSYYDKLDVLDQIASGLSGPTGWIMKRLTGYLVAQGKKGLDAPSA